MILFITMIMFISILILFCVMVNSLDVQVLDTGIHIRQKIKDPLDPVFFSTSDYLHQTWHHACHLHHVEFSNKRIKNTESISGQTCATFRDHLCCYVDKFGWMPVYEEAHDDTFFKINDMGQHAANLPHRKLNDCPKIGVTYVPTTSPIAKPTGNPTSTTPTDSPAPTRRPTATRAPTTTSAPTFPTPPSASDDSLVDNVVLYGGVGLGAIAIIIGAIEFGPSVFEWIRLNTMGQPYVRPLP